MTVSFTNLRNTFSKLVTDAFTQGRLASEFHHALVIAPAQAFCTVPPTVADFHVRRQAVAHLNSVHAVVVALVNHVGNGFFVVVEAVCAKRPGRLVLEALRADRFAVVLDFNFLLTCHRTSMAGRFFYEDSVADVFTADEFSPVERCRLAILGRQSTDAGGYVHQHIGAI